MIVALPGHTTLFFRTHSPAHWGLTVGFLLLGYSVVYTVESLSLFFSFLYLDLYLLDVTSISYGSFMS